MRSEDQGSGHITARADRMRAEEEVRRVKKEFPHTKTVTPTPEMYLLDKKGKKQQ